MYDKQLHALRHYAGRARWYDLANRLAATLRGTSGLRERRKAVAVLNLKRGYRVLEVCVGTGTNVALLDEAMLGHGEVVGLDISRAMLRRCMDKARAGSLRPRLVEGDAAQLPFRDASFDAVFHHGGIAEFSDKRAAILEMARIAAPGATIVICDVGVPTDRRLSLVNRLLIKTQPEYDAPPPIEQLPPGARNVSLTWIARGSWYVIVFTNGDPG